jgi:hypothetical protein
VLAGSACELASGLNESGAEVLDTILKSDAVSFEEERLDVADLVLLGLMGNAWARFERDVSRGLALQRSGHVAISPQELKASATEFRYQRRLLSASEFRSWLAARSLTVAELSGVLARTLLRGRTHDEDVVKVEVSAGELAAALRAEALCSGIFKTLANMAIERMAAAHRLGRLGREVVDERVGATLLDAIGLHAAGVAALGEDELRRRLLRLWAYEDALVALREQVAEPVALRRRLAAHGLDWLRLEGLRLRFAGEGAAREARALIDHDGLGVQEVSAIAGTVASKEALYLDEVPEHAAAMLAATAPGEVSATWLQDEQWNVLVVSAKRSPSTGDPLLRERATDELLADVLRRQAAGRVRLHGAF